jgi:hypothetical protein
MRDTRLAQVTALLDDARSLLVDIVDDGPGVPEVDANRIDAARQFINSALTYIQAAGNSHVEFA